MLLEGPHCHRQYENDAVAMVTAIIEKKVSQTCYSACVGVTKSTTEGAF